MNQILSVNSDYNNNYNKEDTKKIINIFCIAVIIVAITMVLLRIYQIRKNKEEASQFEIPEITISSVNEGQVKINVVCNDGIKSIKYIWNENDEQIVNLNGSTTFERILDVPYNRNNVIKVEAISQKDVKSETSNNFGMETDEVKPTIDSITTTGSTLTIEVSDDSGVSYMEYQWEDEEPNKINVVEEDNRKVNAQINIKRGTYKLTFSAVDIYGNKETISRLVTGVNEPEIFVVKYGDVINIKATHDMGIKQISVLINGKLYIYNEQTAGYTKQTTAEVEYPLEPGENEVKIIVHSFEKLSKEDENSEDTEDSLNNYAYKTFVGTTTVE